MKKNVFKIATKFMCVLLALSMTVTLFACGQGGTSTGSSENVKSSESQRTSESQGASESQGSSESSDETPSEFEDNVYTADLCDEVVRSYLNATTVSDEYSIMQIYAGTTHDNQAAVSISVKRGETPVTLRYADNKEMVNAKETTSSSKKISLSDNFYPDKTYYYEATDARGKLVERGTIIPENSPVRIINVSGGRNIRDAGGWRTQSGDTVKYGLLYRGAQLNGRKGGPKLSQKGIDTFRNELKVATELDLRSVTDDGGQTECAFGSDKNYVKISIGQYDAALKSNGTQLKQIFEVLADENNYPLYFHCNAGADRTGTVAFLVGGLLGVSESDLTKDFELTSFGGQGERLRGKDTGNGYSEDGIMQNDSSNYVAWGPMVNYIRNNYVKGDVTDLSGGIEKYLLGIGVKQNDLNKIKALLLGLSEDKTDPMAKETGCEQGGVKVYKLKNGEKFTVQTDAPGHKFNIENGVAACENCSLSGELKELNADASKNFDLNGAISLSGASITDIFGNTVVSSIKFKAETCGTTIIYIAKSQGKNVIAKVNVWSKIIKDQSDLLAANDVIIENTIKKTVCAYYLIDNDIALTAEWAIENSIGYNSKGYKFVGKICGNGHTVSGLKTQSGAALVYDFNGEISDIKLKGEAVNDNSQFLCAATSGGTIRNVKIEILLGEKPLETSASALLGDIGEQGEIDNIYIENVTIIETSAADKQVNRNRSSALGKLYNEANKSKIFINGLTIVGIRPVLVTASGSQFAGEETIKAFFGKEYAANVNNLKVYKSIANYNSANA